VLKAVKRKGWAANRAKIPLMDLLCWHIAYKRRKNDSNKASCNIWVKYWKAIFIDWDAAKANETFPRYDKAILLDALGFYGRYIQDFPEKVLEFSDWMGIPIEPHSVTPDRLKGLLLDAIRPGK